MLELRHRAPRVAHAPRGVDHKVGLEVGLFLVLFDVIAIALAKSPPVDVPDLVAGTVMAMFGKLDREPLEWALVQSRHHSFDHEPRDQLKPAEPRECGRVECEIGFLRFACGHR